MEWGIMTAAFILKTKLDCVMTAVLSQNIVQVSKSVAKVIKFLSHNTPSAYVTACDMEYIEVNMELIDIIIDHYIFEEAQHITQKCIDRIDNKICGTLMMYKRLQSIEDQRDVGTLTKLPKEIRIRIGDTLISQLH